MSTVAPKGRFFVKLYGPDGVLKQAVEGDNVVTEVGKEFIASFLQSAAVAAATFTVKYIAIGTATTAESVADTALGTEVARQTGTVSYTSGGIYQVTATFAAGTGTGAIAEYGLFSTSTAGTCVARDTESVINKGAGDTLTVTHQTTYS